MDTVSGQSTSAIFRVFRVCHRTCGDDKLKLDLVQLLTLARGRLPWAPGVVADVDDMARKIALAMTSQQPYLRHHMYPSATRGTETPGIHGRAVVRQRRSGFAHYGNLQLHFRGYHRRRARGKW